MKLWLYGLCLASLVGCTSISTEAKIPPAEAMGGYAIVIFPKAAADAEWIKAADALEQKYPGAFRITCTNGLEDAKAELSTRLPRYTAIVMKPEEAGLNTTLAISRMMRRLDDDPYVDTFWSVLTGYTAEDAVRVAKHAEPLRIERALDCAGMDLSVFKKAWRYSEDHRGIMKSWDAAIGKVEETKCSTDNTQGVIDCLVKEKVQFVTTSGHATQRDWQMGYCGPNMQMRHRDGVLLAYNTQSVCSPVFAPEPKVYLGTGNCLIGDIDKPDCMATSWIHTGGAYQFCGYSVTTWFGKMGWGMMGMFGDNAGLYSFNEAFHFNNTRIVDWLIDLDPNFANMDIPRFEHFTLPRPDNFNELITKHPELRKNNDISGNWHDRDVVAFYGDPAWNARPVGRFEKEMRVNTLPGRSDAVQIITQIKATSNGTFRGEGIYIALPGSFDYTAADVEIHGVKAELQCVDNFLHISPKGDYKTGKTITVTVTATRKGRAQ